MAEPEKYCDSRIDSTDIIKILENFQKTYMKKFPWLYFPDKPLPNTKLYPIVNIDPQILYDQFTITQEADRKYIKKQPVLKVFDCQLCSLSEKENNIRKINIGEFNSSSREFTPDYAKFYESLSGRKFCIENDHFIISMVNEVYYKNQALISSKYHTYTYNIFIDENLFTALFGLLIGNEGTVAFHNGIFGSQPTHFHVDLSSSEYYIKSNINLNLYEFVPYFNNTDEVFFYKINEPVQKGVVFASKYIHIATLFKVLNRLFTKNETNINSPYYLASAFFALNHYIFAALFLVNSKFVGLLLPASGMVFVDPNSPIDYVSYYKEAYQEWSNGMVSLNENDTLYLDKYSSQRYPKNFVSMPLVLLSQMVQKKTYRDELTSFINEDIIKIYQGLLLDVFNKLDTDFDNRLKYRNYGRYQIFLTLFFAPKNDGDLDKLHIEGKKIVSDIIRMEIFTRIKIFGLNASLSFLKGSAISILMAGLMDNTFFFELVETKKRIGSPSAHGLAYRTGFKNLGDSMIKFTTNTPESILEFNNCKETNKLREFMPHFMYVYARFSCIDEVFQDANGDIILKNEKLCATKNIKNIPMCNLQGRPDKKINCLTATNFLFVELLDEGISFFEYINKIDPTDLESIADFYSVLLQICLALKVAQEKIGFNHNDLHTDNIMLMENPNSPAKTIYSYLTKDGEKHNVRVFKYIPVLIDFGTARTNNTAEEVKQAWGQVQSNKDYFSDLCNFSPDSDILSFLTIIKTDWYMRFFYKIPENNIPYKPGEYKYGMPITYRDALERVVLKNMIFNKEAPEYKYIYMYDEPIKSLDNINGISTIDNFLRLINFNPNMNIAYKTTNFVKKSYKPGSNFSSLDSIIKILEQFQSIIDSNSPSLKFDWGDYSNTRIGPKTVMDPRNQEAVEKLKTLVDSFMDTD